jgi:hypothetical protein
VNGEQGAPGDVGSMDLWFVEPRKRDEVVLDPIGDRQQQEHEELVSGALAADLLGGSTGTGNATGTREEQRPKGSSAPVNKFAQILPPLPELEPEEVDDVLFPAERTAPAVRGTLWIWLGALLAVGAMVAVALVLHPWAHAGVPAH